jgi:hypothetical protein
VLIPEVEWISDMGGCQSDSDPFRRFAVSLFRRRNRLKPAKSADVAAIGLGNDSFSTKSMQMGRMRVFLDLEPLRKGLKQIGDLDIKSELPARALDWAV